MATVTSVTKHFTIAKEGFTTTLNGTISSGAATVVLNSVSGYTNGDNVCLVIDPTDATKKQVFTGVVDTSGVQITGVVWTEGTNQTHTTGATVVDYWTATHWDALTKGLLVSHNQDGTMLTNLPLKNPFINDTTTATKQVKFGISGATASTASTLTFVQSANRAITFQDADHTVVGRDTTDTLTNKRVTPRVGTVADAATVTPTGDSSDLYTVTALAQAATIAAPSGTPTNGQKLVLRLLDNGTGRALTWNAIYRAIGVTLPTTTVANKTHYIGLIYNSADTKWDAVAVVAQA